VPPADAIPSARRSIEGTPGEAMTHTYQIRVRGHLSDKRAEWFDGLTIENQPDGEALITGPVADQAALHGLLIRIRDLGLPLLSVVCVEPRKDTPDDTGE
jgi:hypothetical protein